PRSRNARLQSVPHSFSTEWIHHSRGITDRNEFSRQPFIIQRSGDHAIVPAEIPRERILLYKKARIRAAAFDRNRTPITVLKEGKLQNAAAIMRCEVLNTELLGRPMLRKSAQFSGGINDDRTTDIVHTESVCLNLHFARLAALPNIRAIGH